GMAWSCETGWLSAETGLDLPIKTAVLGTRCGSPVLQCWKTTSRCKPILVWLGAPSAKHQSAGAPSWATWCSLATHRQSALTHCCAARLDWPARPKSAIAASLPVNPQAPDIFRWATERWFTGRADCQGTCHLAPRLAVPPPWMAVCG